MDAIKRRATTIAEQHEYRSKMLTPEEFTEGLKFIPRPDDIII